VTVSEVMPGRQAFDVSAGVAGFLEQFLLRGFGGIVMTVFVAHETGGKIDDARVDGTAELFDEENAVVVRHRENHHRRLSFRPLDELPAVALQNQNLFPFEDFLRVVAHGCATIVMSGGKPRACS